MVTRDYNYLSVSSVQCPRCGNVNELTIHSNTGYTLEYAGVCSTEMDSGVLCGVMLSLQVTAHLFPVEPT